MGKKWWVIKVWQNGVHTLIPVEMGQMLWEKWQPGSRKLYQEQSTCWSSNLEEQKSDCEWAWAWFGSFALVRSIQDLGCPKVCVQLVPRALSEDHKVQGMFSVVSFLLQYAIQSHDFLEHIITWDWKWVHHHSVESQHASIEWKPPWFPWPKKFKMGISTGRVMSSVFWDHKGILLVDFMEKSAAVNVVSNCATLEMLWAAINWQRPGLLTAGVLLLHNNARPHAMTATQQPLQNFRWTVLEHAPYSPHLVLSDYHLFQTHKDHRSGHKICEWWWRENSFFEVAEILGPRILQGRN
jgi:hypothetical protein